MTMAMMKKTAMINSIIPPEVQVIRQKTPEVTMQSHIKRVGVYCRVSTDLEDQQSSLHAQMTGFQSLIRSRPGWTMIDTYADEGLTGTNASKRREFQRMMTDCESGKLDYIVTKSISRFARNTVDTLQYVRKLRELGIYVYFERERLDTAAATSELILTVLAAVAQEESHSISENQKWAYRKRFQAGIANWTNIYGYRKGEQGEFVIVEEEAQAVRRMFALYAQGHSLPQICRLLNQEGVRTTRGNQWHPMTVSDVLHNEKYVGDLAMQKMYTVDHLTHKVVKNDAAIVPRYYVKDHHAAIVDRKTYDIVQTILALKDLHRGSSQYPYYGFLICPLCGEKMVRSCLPIKTHDLAWTCGGADRDDEQGAYRADRTTCPPYALREKYVERLLRTAFGQLTLADLRKTAQGSGRKAKAARAALQWKERDPRLKKIEYLFLIELVGKISFPKWTEVIVEWRFGISSAIEIQYDKSSDAPIVETEVVDGRYYFNGKLVRRGAIMMHQSLQRITNHINKIWITQSRTPDGHFERPTVQTEESTTTAMQSQGSSMT